MVILGTYIGETKKQDVKSSERERGYASAFFVGASGTLAT